MADQPDNPQELELWENRLATARQGSNEALGHLLDEQRPYLLAIANSEVDSGLLPKVGASDLVQESLLEAVRDFPRFEGHTPAQLAGWLRGILLHNLANLHRAYRGTAKRRLDVEVEPDGRSRPENDLIGSSASPVEKAIRNEVEQRLEQALARLPDAERQIIIWRNREGRPFNEIGQLLGCTTDAARMRWTRALEALKQRLEGDSG